MPLPSSICDDNVLVVIVNQNISDSSPEQSEFGVGGQISQSRGQGDVNKTIYASLFLFQRLLCTSTYRPESI